MCPFMACHAVVSRFPANFVKLNTIFCLMHAAFPQVFQDQEDPRQEGKAE
jgi:hypothetical protein